MTPSAPSKAPLVFCVKGFGQSKKSAVLNRNQNWKLRILKMTLGIKSSIAALLVATIPTTISHNYTQVILVNKSESV